MQTGHLILGILDVGCLMSSMLRDRARLLKRDLGYDGRREDSCDLV